MTEPTRVLVVDDDEPIRRMVTLAFELEGFEVGTATDGLDAIAQTRLFRPDVVVMDIMMPKMDGLTALGHLRQQRETRDLPVLLLSAKADSTDVMIGMRAGATDYVTKPFEADDLVTRTRQAVETPAARPRRAASAPRWAPPPPSPPVEAPAAIARDLSGVVPAAGESPTAEPVAAVVPPPPINQAEPLDLPYAVSTVDTVADVVPRTRRWTDYAVAAVLVAVLVVIVVLLLNR